MNERDFLTLARALVRMPEEAAWRSAVSRSYYATFHVARSLFTSLDFAVPHADRAHAYLWLRLSNCGDAPTRLAGSDLNVLRQRRNVADYDLRRPLGQAVARAAVLSAEQIVQALDAAAVEPVRSQIATEMARYERDVLKDVTRRP